jgi:hypothetical protein
VSRGAPWPDTPDVSQPTGGVILLSAEDDVADTIVPRLKAAGADCTRVFALASVSDLARDIEKLRAAIEQADDCRLVVVDPISAYMGKADSHVNAEVRAALSPLAELASANQVAILAVTHLRKSGGAAIYRAMGSVAFAASARAVWAVARDKSDPDRRLLLPVKNNLAAEADAVALSYTIESHDSGAPVVRWCNEPVSITVDEALAPDNERRGRPPAKRAVAEGFLRDTLADGPRLATDLLRDAKRVGIAEATLDRAKAALEIKSFRESAHGPWWWELDGAQDEPIRQLKPSANGRPHV